MDTASKAGRHQKSKMTQAELNALINGMGGPKGIADIYPMTPLQQGILYQSALTSEAQGYVVSVSCRLDAELDADLFEHAWRRAVERHSILRTAFTGLDLAKPVQVVLKAAELSFTRLDWRDLPPDETARRLRDLRDAERARPFEFERPPLMRVALVRTGDTDHRLVWTFHHLILDGWSLPLLVGEVFAHYEAATGGRDAALPPLQPFKDYVAWLQRQDFAPAQAYWREALAGLDHPTLLGSGGPSAAPGGEARTLRRALTIDLATLERFARDRKLTLNNLVSAAWGFLLSRYGRAREVVFGMVVSGRPADLPDAEARIGLFISTLPVRLRVFPQMRIEDYLRQVQAQQNAVLDHETTPPHFVQDWSPLGAGTPLFDSTVLFENYPIEGVRSVGMLQLGEVEFLENPHYALNLQFSVYDARLQFSVTYDPRRIEDERADAVARHLSSVLRQMVADPECGLGDIDLLTDEERERLLGDGAATHAPYPDAACLQDLLAAQAKRTPDAEAVTFGDRSLSYAALDARANQLAHELQAMGVGPDAVVALCVERSPAMIIGLLGILKAGGAYLPLDPEYPRDRLLFMLEDSGAAVLVTDTATIDLLEGAAVRRLDLDGLAQALDVRPTAPPPCAARAANLAYVIYTSGSTGRPKGVMVEHRALLNFLWSMIGTPGLGPMDVLAAVTPLSFDIAGLEIWGPLLVGARVVVVDRATSQDADRLRKCLTENGATVMQATPATWRLLAEVEPCGVRVLCGGEALPRDLARKMCGWGSPVWNLYGPTETTIWSTVHPLARAPTGPRIPIGRPIANTRVYVLGAELELAPVGVPGELYIGGAGLARGYLDRPALTAERFLPDPYGDVPGSRMYRTGDLARWTLAGELEFLERADDQVKIRGFRIELGEIEAALESQPQIGQAVVVAREDQPGDKRLIAYLVGAGGAEVPGAEQIRGGLRVRLPDYMQPHAFVTLDALPLTPSGKVDRKSLPAPEMTGGQDHVAPRDEREATLAGIWSEALGLDRVGVRDNFFELGGDSIKSIQVVARARRAGLSFTLRDFFENQTIEALLSVAPSGAEPGDEPTQQAARPFASAHLPQNDLDALIDGFGGARQVLDVYRASPLQQGLLFHSRYSPESQVYTISVVCRLTGPLDIGAFEQAWRHAVQSHDVLRTAFAGLDGPEPLQVVLRDVELPFSHHDLRDLEPADRERRLRELTSELRERRFDFARPPLLRVAVIQTADEEHRLVWTMHHGVIDGWSIPLVLNEVAAAYRAASEGALPEPSGSLPFRDYVDWLERRDRTQADDYWRERLAGVTAATRLGVDLSAGAASEAAGTHAAAAFTLRADIRALEAFARQRRVTLNTVASAAWALVLNAYGGEPDVVFGVTLSGRPADLPEVERRVGLFVNTLPLRVSVHAQATVSQWLSELHRSQLDLLEHQSSPLADIQRHTALPYGAPIFESALVFQNYPLDRFNGPFASDRLVVDQMSSVGQTHFPLYLEFLPTAGGLRLTVTYQEDRFEPAAIDGLGRHVDHVLQQMMSAPEARLCDISLLADAERTELLTTRNATATDYPAARCLHELFAEQAARTPAALAVACGGERLTFGELERRANDLAHRLSAAGVGPDVVVGACLDRSPDLVVGLLGILKAGGAYLPLDPDHPAERIAFMLRDSQARAMLTQDGVADDIVVGYAGPVVRLGADAPPLGDATGGPPHSGVGPENLACVIYTSGSTGRAKGVMTPHRGAVNRVYVQPTIDPISGASVFVQKASISFVDAFYEILCPLLLGKPVVIAPAELVLDTPRFIERLRTSEASHLVSVPSLAAAMLRAGNLGSLRHLRSWTLGGETCWPETLAALLRLLPDCRFMNNYGSTEVSDSATVHIVRPSDAGVASIGRPVGNVRAYVLDARLQPSPVGVPGELYIAGDGVTRGYIGQPGLTAERFLPDPFGAPGSRMYHTGDRARWGHDGEMEFLGRSDRQVKVRGVRIELDELEQILLEHPGVGQAAVLATHDDSGDTRIAAYVVPVAPLEVRDIWAYLRRRLPTSLHPAGLAVLETLPRTASGKLDRQALRAIDLTRGRPASAPPQSAREHAIVDLFERVLNCSGVGLDDNFFELGGHSLLATQLVGLAREALGIDVPLRLIFDAPTAGAFSQALDGHSTGDAAARPRLAPQLRPASVPLSFAQQQFYFLDELAMGRGAYNIPATLRLVGRLDLAALRMSLSEIVRRHEILRTRVLRVDDRLQQIVDPARPFPLELVDLSAIAPADRAIALNELVGQAICRPFDLGAEHPLHAKIVRLADDEHHILATFHHIASDEWSLGLLAREISTLYAAYRAEQPSPLRELPLQYADYAIWQRSEAGSRALPDQLERWRTELAGVGTVLHLPLDHPRPAVGDFQAADLPFAIAPPLAGQLRDLARRENVTLFMVLLAGLQTVLGRWSGQTSFLVGTPVAGRTDSQLELLIGCFINTLALRADLSGEPTVRELLARVREATLAAYANQDLPFETLVAELNPERDLSRHPLFQVMLTLQNVPDTVLHLDGVRIELNPLKEAKAKFDLLVVVSENAGGISGRIQYAADLFDVETIERFAEQLRLAFEQMAAASETRLGALTLLPAVERRRLLVDWNATSAAYPETLLLHELVAAQATRTPQATAAVHGRERLSYEALDRRSNQLARRLQAMGVGPDVVVALYLNRSLDTLVGMLGVLKAGGAYLPLDPTYPPERTARMLEDARAPIVLTNGDLDEELPAQGARVLALDMDWPLIAREAETPPPRRAHPENLAYLIYTSGSTGQPKGVMMRHRAAVNHMLWMREAFPLSATDVVLQKTSTSFDASVWEIFAPLCEGASVVLAPDGVHRDPEAIAGLIAEAGVTRAQFVPAALGAFLAAADHTRSPLKDLFCGGGALDVGLDAAARVHLGLGVHNLYGPSETCIQSVVHPAGDPPVGTAPIGRPISNTRVYVLDAELGLQPTGVIGEIYVAGEGLARGYLRRPGMSAERFVPDPFGPSGSRMYRTGDLGRWRNGGALEYAGRIDEQVKLRGFRVETKEIEAELMVCADIAQCAVRLWTDAGDARLVAYVVAAPGCDEPQAARLRAHLSRTLPGYMIPQQFVALAALPLTSNGKLDHEALPEPPRMTATSAYVAPRTPREQILAAIWAEVLNRDEVGIHDNFFELGGDSIKAVQIVARAKREGLRVTLSAMFQTPTVAELADRIVDTGFGSMAAADVMAPLLPLHEAGDGPPLFCLHPSLGFSWCYANLAQALEWRHPIYGLQATGFADAADFYRSVGDLAADHLRHIRRVQPKGPYHLLGYSFGGLLAHEIARRLEASGEVVALLCVADTEPRPDPVELSDLALASDLLQFLGVSAPHLLAKPEVDFEAVVGFLVHMNKLPDMVGKGEVGWLVAMIKGIIAVANDFVPGRVECEMLYLAATQESEDWTLRPERWRRHVGGPIRVVEIQSNHVDLFADATIGAIAQALRGNLQDARPPAEAVTG